MQNVYWNTNAAVVLNWHLDTCRHRGSFCVLRKKSVSAGNLNIDLESYPKQLLGDRIHGLF